MIKQVCVCEICKTSTAVEDILGDIRHPWVSLNSPWKLTPVEAPDHAQIHICPNCVAPLVKVFRSAIFDEFEEPKEADDGKT